MARRRPKGAGIGMTEFRQVRCDNVSGFFSFHIHAETSWVGWIVNERVHATTWERSDQLTSMHPLAPPHRLASRAVAQRRAQTGVAGFTGTSYGRHLSKGRYVRQISHAGTLLTSGIRMPAGVSRPVLWSGAAELTCTRTSRCGFQACSERGSEADLAQGQDTGSRSI